jgi:hypothetical protein
MEELDFNKDFRFVLQQEDVILYEKMFDANVISPITRNYIDIRGELYGIIKRIQNLLSKRIYQTGVRFDNQHYDFYEYNKNQIKKYPKHIQKDLIYSPDISVKEIDNRTLRGVSCKFGLYINENLIVERFFYVENFNPDCRWSVNLVDEMNEITQEIYDDIIKKDKRNIWNDYDIINRTGMTISQVREMPQRDRNRWLYRINN